MGHSEVSVENSLYGADCDGIVVTEDPVRSRTSAQQPAHAFITRLISVPGIHNVACRYTEAPVCQRFAVALQTLPGDADSGTAQVRDLPAPPGDEMLCGQSPDSAIVGPDEGRLQSGDGPVDQNIRHFSRLDLLEESQTSHWLRRRNDQPVYLPGQKGISFAHFQFGIFLGIRNDHVIA